MEAKFNISPDKEFWGELKNVIVQALREAPSDDAPIMATTPESGEYAAVAESKKVSQYSLEDVRSAIANVAKSDGTEKAKAILSSFGASRVTELATDQYEAVMKAAGAIDYAG